MPAAVSYAPTLRDRVAAAREFIVGGRLDEAEAVLGEIGTGNGDPDALNARASLELARRQIGRAFELLAEAATAYPDHADLVANLGIAHELHGRFDEAVVCLERAAALAPNNEDVKLSLAHALLSRGDIAQARTLTEAAVRHDPAKARAFVQLGAIDLVARDRLAAEAALLRALELAPNDPDALRNLSALYITRGQFDRALELAERAHLRAPLDSAVVLHLAYCRAAAGRWAEAETICRKLLAYAPAHLGAREIIARVMIARGDVERGIAELGQVVRTRQSDPAPAMSLARALQLAGRFEDAIKIADHALRLAPDKEAIRALKLSLELALGRFPPREPTPIPYVSRVAVPPTTGALEFVVLTRLLNRLAAKQVVRVVAEPRYQPLLASLKEQVIPDEPQPRLSVTPLPALLRMFAPDAETVAGDVPYLRPDPQLLAKWSDALAEFSRPLVGIVWDGGPLGLSMEQINGLLPENATPVSLVTDDSRHDLRRNSRPIDAGVHIKAPAEMIAAVANLDAVVAPDGFAIHIAGALGRPGIVLVPCGYPWYWAAKDGRALWYPSIEVIAQERLGQWDTVISEASRQLAAMLEADAREQP
jgi:Flp pilus assembly protein TadD